MAKISAIDFANNVRQNKQRLIQHCNDNGVAASDADSLDIVVTKNNTVNLESSSALRPTRNVYNWDGTLISSEIVNIGDAVTVPSEAPTISDSRLVFDKWVKTASSSTVQYSYNIGAICKVAEQIDINGTLVRPTLIDIIISDAIGLSPTLRWSKQSSASVLYIDWGDGTIDTISSGSTGSTNHTYSTAGRYTIKMYSANTYKISTNSTANCTFGSSDYQRIVHSIYFGDNVTTIGNYALYNCFNLKKVMMPYGITAVEMNTFTGCYSLESVVLPDSLTIMGSQMFYTCSSLKNVIIPNTITITSNSCFSGCSSLESIILPDSLITIETNTFYNCYALKSIIIPASVTTMNSRAVSGCYGLTSIIIPNSVIILSINAFASNHGLKSVIISDNITSINDYLFSACFNLESINLPNNITLIGLRAFESCSSLKSLTIPETVTVIGDYAFLSCSSLESLTIPDLVANIGRGAFDGCYLLKSLTIPQNWSNNINFLNSCNNLSDESWVSLGNRIADLTGQTAKVLSLTKSQKIILDTIKVNAQGEIDAQGTMTLSQFITNKNWTISVS